MRILLLGMYANAEGELSYEARMVHHLAQMGNEIDYWTDSPLSYMMEPVLKQPPTLRSFVFKEGKNALAKTPRQFHPLDVKRIMKEHTHHENPGYDLIFTTSQTGIDMGVWLKQVLDIPLVVQILDVPHWRLNDFGPQEIYKQAVVPLPLLPTELFNGYRGEWQWWFSNFDKIDRITTILEEAKNYIVQFSGVDPSKVSISHHGSVDTDSFDYFIKQRKVERKNQVLVVERIDFHKGVDQSVLVCKLIQDMMGDSAPEFVFTSRGNQAWYENLVKDFAKAYLKKHRFTGWVDNPTKIGLIRESKVMLVNEWPNGFGSCTIGEAVYCGTQMIGWDTPSKKEVHPGGGFTRVPLNDYEAMARAAVHHLQNFEETKPEEREWVAKYRSNKSHAESIHGILEGVLRR